MPFGNPAQRVLAKVSRVPGADALWESSTKSLSESLEGAGRRCPLKIRAKSLSESLEGAGRRCPLGIRAKSLS